MSSPSCETCGAELSYVRDEPAEPSTATESGVSVPLASEIYRCSTHGLWRIYANGTAKLFIDGGEQPESP